MVKVKGRDPQNISKEVKHHKDTSSRTRFVKNHKGKLVQDNRGGSRKCIRFPTNSLNAS